MVNYQIRKFCAQGDPGWVSGYHLAIVDELMEDMVHHCLECCRGVTQSEKHDSWFKQPSVSSEHGLPLIIFLDLHVVESPAEIKYGEELGIMEVG